MQVYFYPATVVLRIPYLAMRATVMMRQMRVKKLGKGRVSESVREQSELTTATTEEAGDQCAGGGDLYTWDHSLRFVYS